MQNGENQAPSPSSSSFPTADEIENYQETRKENIIETAGARKGLPKIKKSTLV
jgi:hypothetical protein